MKVLKIKPGKLFAFERMVSNDEIIKEMRETMKSDDKLAKMMNKFYLSIKF